MGDGRACVADTGAVGAGVLFETCAPMGDGICTGAAGFCIAAGTSRGPCNCWAAEMLKAGAFTGDGAVGSALSVDGERVRDDSGRLNGDCRGEPNDSGDGFFGEVEALCCA